MKKRLQLPDIPKEEQTPLVQSLLALLEQFAERIEQQDEEIARLKDEVSILKGEKKRPKFKASKLDSQTDADDEVSDTSGDQLKKRAGSEKKAKNSHQGLDRPRHIAWWLQTKACSGHKQKNCFFSIQN